MKKIFGCITLLALAGLMAFSLTACGNDTNERDAIIEGDALAALEAALERFPEYRNLGGVHVAGTTFTRGILSPHPLPGLYGGAIFSNAAVDSDVMAMLGTNSSLLSMTEAFTFGQDGVVTFEANMGNNSFTFTMQRDVYWHDGTPLTLADLVFTYYVLAHPDYTGIRFSTYEQQIVGIMDFHNGDADHIAGLVLSADERTLTMYFESMSPAMLYFGIWTAPMPAHIFSGIPVADMASSPAVLVNPVGWGPFMIQNIVPGESVHMVRNPNYTFGVPYIENMIVRRVASSSLVPAHMAAGDLDMVTFPALYFEDHQNPTNFNYVGSRNGQYGYIAFRLGHWDTENRQNIFDPNRTMNNVYLRRAMSLAVDQNEIGAQLFAGLQFQAGSFIAPNHPGLMDLSLPGFRYDPDEANRILDEAGFTMGADGFRTWPNGDELTVIWAHPTDAATEHIIVPFHQQGWAAIGVRVELWQGRTHDQLFLWDTLDYDTDNDEIHIYTGNWVAGANPNPSGRWGHAVWNPSRYNSPEWEAILANLSSTSAFDENVMRQYYFDMQAYLQDVVPYFPLRWSITLTAINNRVDNFEMRNGVLPVPTPGWHQIRLTAADPYRQ